MSEFDKDLSRQIDLIDWQNPVADHPLNHDSVGWFLAVQNRLGWGSSNWTNLITKNPAILASSDPASDWDLRARKGAFGSVLGAVQGRRFNSGVACPTGTRFSASVWVRPNSQQGSGRYVLDCSDVTTGFGLRGNTGSWTAFFYPTSGIRLISSAGTQTVGVWTHLVITYDGDRVRFYQDGQYVAISSGFGTVTSIVDSGSNIIIGAEYTEATASAYDGSIDDVRFWNRQLISTEIEELYQESLRNYPTLLNRVSRPRFYIPSAAAPPLYFHLPMGDNPAGGTQADAGDYGFNGVAFGSMSSGNLVTGVDGNAWEFDGTSQYMEIPKQSDGWEVPGGFINTGLAWDTVDEVLWIGDFGNDKIISCQPDGTYVGEISVSDGPQGVAYDSSDDTLWWADYTNNAIRHITKAGADAGDSITGLSFAPNGLSYEAATDSIWVAVDVTATVRRYSCSTGSLLETISVSDTGSNFDGVFYDPDMDHLYISEDGSDQIIVANAADGTNLLEIFVKTSPEDIAVVDGLLHICHDREFHDALADGNRVHQLLYALQRGSFSVGFHLEPVSTSGTDAVMVNGNPVSGIGWGFYLTSTTNLRVFMRDGTNSLFFDRTIGSGFTHIGLTVNRDDDEAIVYLDGVQSGSVEDISSVTGIIHDLRQPIAIGASPDGDLPRYAAIKVDDVRMYGGALSAEQMAELPTLSAGGGGVFGVNLGSTQINKIYLGTTEIKRVFLGTTMVYENV